MDKIEDEFHELILYEAKKDKNNENEEIFKIMTYYKTYQHIQ